MKPIPFIQSNVILRRPPEMTEEECQDMEVCVTVDDSGNQLTISKWEVTEEDIDNIRKNGGIFVGIIGNLIPPIFLSSVNILPEPFDPENN